MLLLLTVVKLLSKNTTVESSVNVFNNRLGYTQLHISRSAILPATSRTDILAAVLKFSTEAVTSLVIVINCPFTYPVASTLLQQYSRHWSTFGLYNKVAIAQVAVMQIQSPTRPFFCRGRLLTSRLFPPTKSWLCTDHPCFGELVIVILARCSLRKQSAPSTTISRAQVALLVCSTLRSTQAHNAANYVIFKTPPTITSGSKYSTS